MRRWLLVLFIIVFTVAGFAAEPWPTEKWMTSTPEQQGMDSSLLSKALTYLDSQYMTEGVMVIRHGHVVMESYFAPYQRNEPHIVFSCTKSVMSTLIGIAIHDGAIQDVQQKVAELLSDYPLSEQLKNLTLENLLTMTAGFAWDDGSQFGQLIQSKDWVRFVLDLPVATEPGTQFNYNSGVSHLLSAILQKATGQTAAAYAEKKLFGPLGIKDYRWGQDPQGRSFGGSELYLTVPDMAKIGYLFLHRGQWNGSTIVPATWVETATRKQIAAGRDPLGATDYGYQWWTNAFGGYSARGYAGQYIFVMPEQDLVAVFVSDRTMARMWEPQLAMKNFILPSIKSDKPLPPNDKAVKALEDTIKRLAK